MPKLLLFAACERAIINEDDNNVSLITILNEISVPLSADTIPEKARVAFQWQILAVWLREPGDGEKSFEQMCELIMPDNRSALKSQASFSMHKRVHRQRLVVQGFPTSKIPGECLLRLSVREHVEGRQWQPVAEYPILQKHTEVQSGQPLS